MNYLLTIEVNAEGNQLAYLGRGNKKDGWTGGGCYRLSGPKAWGGSRIIAKFELSEDDIIRALKSGAPEVFERLKDSND